MTLVSPQELSDYMSGIRMNEAQERSAAQILAGVQADLEHHLNRSLEPRRSREMVRVDRNGFVNVRHTPVQAVLRITDYGSTLPVPASDVVPNYLPTLSENMPLYDYAPDNNGASYIVPGGVRYGTPGSYVLIEYVAGGSQMIMDHLPQVKTAILRVAAREFEQMHDDTMSLRNATATPPADKGVQVKGWTDDELRRFDRLRRRVVV
jgi:hypothetical protein